jgi:hypothetical protein
MEKSHHNIEEGLEDGKAAVEMHEKVGSSVEHDPDPENATQEPFRRRGIDENREKRILLKLDIHILPFVSLLYLLSAM